MSLLGDHLRIPMGLGIDNIREFILEDPLEITEITVASESILDNMYERMVVSSHHPKKKMNNNNKTHKKHT
jgi:hypothetical protein